MFRCTQKTLERYLSRLLGASPLLFAMACAVWTVPAFATDWQAELADGRRISVDLDSNRVLVVAGTGRGSPLWDGVHRLRDGSVVTIRSGLMVPNRAVLAARQAPPHQAQQLTVSACSQLIEKACGALGACDETQACDLAKQLREMQWTGVGPDPAADDWAEARCRQGLADDAAFTQCDIPLADDADVCQRLVHHLCGTNDRCAASEGCKIGRQMLDLEQDALRDDAAEYVLDARRQCRSVLREHAYFPPCR